MLKIALRVGRDFSRHIREHRHKIPPYKFLLEHSPPPWSNCQIKSNNIGIIIDRTYFFESTRFKSLSISLGAQNFYRLTKVLILLLNPEFFKVRRFFIGTNQLLKHICFNYFDYKYSEMYEEEIIIRYVQIFEANKYVNEEKYKITCEFLLLLLMENEHLQVALNKMTSAYYEREEALTELDLYKKNSVTKKDLSIYSYPTALIRFIDKEHMYNSTYHGHYKRKPDQPYIAKHDQTKHFWVKPEMMEELLRIYKNDEPYIKNSKISRLDFFTALNYILNRQFYSEKILEKFQTFLEEYDELYKEQSPVDAVQFLESMMLCRLFETLVGNSQIISQDFHRKIKNEYYKKYSERYVSYLQNITFKPLFQLLTHTSNLFPKHAPWILESSIDPSRITNAYKTICQQILDYYNNGQLVVESFNLNSIFQLIYANFGKNELQWMVDIMQKYEKSVYLWTFNTKKAERRYRNTVVYLLLIKYGLKSDLIVENLYSFLEKEAWISSQISNLDNRNTNEINIYSEFNNLFLYFLYLEVIQNPSKESQEIERVLLTKIPLLKLFLDDIQSSLQKIQTQKIRKMKNAMKFVYQKTGLKMNTSIKSFHNRIIVKTEEPTQNFFVNLYKVLMVTDKAYQILREHKQKEQILNQDSLQELFSQTYKLIKSGVKTQKLISYPLILRCLCKISVATTKLTLKAELYRQISEIALYLKNVVTFNKLEASKIIIYNQGLMTEYNSLYNNLQSVKQMSLAKYMSQVPYDRQLDQFAKILKQQLEAQGYFEWMLHKKQANEEANIGISHKVQNVEELEKQLQESLQRDGSSDKLVELKEEQIIKQIEELIKSYLSSAQNKNEDLAQLAKEIFVLVKENVLQTQDMQTTQRHTNSLQAKTKTLFTKQQQETKQQDSSIEDALQKIDINKRKAIVKTNLIKNKKDVKKPLFSPKAKLTEKTETSKKLFKNLRKSQNEVPTKTQVDASTKTQQQTSKKIQQSPVAQGQQEDIKKMIRMMRQKFAKTRVKQTSKRLFTKKK